LAKGKDKKRNVGKRRQRANEDRKRRRKLKVIKLKEHAAQAATARRAPLAEMEAPDGFRTVSTSQAVMAYAAPLMEKAGTEPQLQAAFQAAMGCWNYSLAVQEGDRERERALEADLLATLRARFDMEETAAREFLAMMAARYDHLFPEAIQPRGTPFTFMRKEAAHPIRPIEEDRLDLDPAPVPLTPQEEWLLRDLRELDALVEEEADWDAVEGRFTAVKDPLRDAFQEWLTAKGLEESLAAELAGCLFIWLDFVYAYDHAEDTRLAAVPASSWQEFFLDFLLRKMVVDPPEYVTWPPALKLFYRYLHDRGYLEDPQAMERSIARMEPDFYEFLERQFA